MSAAPQHDPTWKWRQQPGSTIDIDARSVEERYLPDGSFAQTALAVMVAAAGPALRVVSVSDVGAALAVLLTCVAGSLLVGRTTRSDRSRRLGLWAAVCVIVFLVAGPIAGLWALGVAVLSDWAIRRRAPLPFLPPGDGLAVVPVVVLTSLAAWRGMEPGVAVGAAVLLAGAFVATWLSGCCPESIRHVISAFGAAIAGVVATLAFGALGIFLVVVPWLVQRALRIDPLMPRVATGEHTSWLVRARRDVRAGHLWASEMVEGPRPSAVWRARLAALVVCALALGLISVFSGRSHSESPMGGLGDTRPAAYKSAEWYGDYQEDIAWIWNRATAWNPLGPQRIRDVRTRTVNVTDGVRRSWRPPECTCRRLKVWMYGGSTTFGLGQRDGHTIASELARAAWAEGIAVDIDNRGVPGDVHWEEAQRYAWDVATYGPPDMVFFYDGFNEQWATQILANRELGDAYAPVDPVTEDFWQNEGGFGGPLSDLSAPDAPPGAHLLSLRPVKIEGPVEAAELTMRRYDRSRKISRDISVANGVPTSWFWQPTRLSRPAIEGEPAPSDPDGEAWARRREAETEQLIPADVHDLTSALDGTDAPIFSDDAHHNEVGARLIAAAIWSDLAAELRLLGGE